jgi:1-deoxy-D-xylulose-5-phosphate reductoisomerase
LDKLKEKRKISIFGSTGSIGQNTVELIALNRASYDVVAITGGRNVVKLAEQARLLDVDLVVTGFDDCFWQLKELMAGTNTRVAAGKNAILEASDIRADIFVSAIIGFSGLEPSIRALKHGTTLALANKESLVVAGTLLMSESVRFGAKIIPIDSEHSGIFQLLSGNSINDVEKIIITASGGKFRDWTQDEILNVTLNQASEHPTWTMGKRITIDSNSLFNKAMELIETKEFFQVDHKKIEVLIHPQSIVHALVCFVDGGMLAHLSDHDMKHAINYALNWPARRNSTVKSLDLTKVASLNFENVREDIFTVLKLARDVMDAGGLRGTVFNAAKEIALDRFISSEVGFLDMNLIVERTLSELEKQNFILDVEQDLGNIVYLNSVARRVAKNLILK